MPHSRRSLGRSAASTDGTPARPETNAAARDASAGAKHVAEHDALDLPTLETARLILEPLRLAHARAMLEGLQVAELYRFIPQDPPVSLDTLEARYRRVLAGATSSSERWCKWVAVERSSGAPCGDVELTLVEHGRRAYLGYTFLRPFWGRGIAYEACEALLAYGRAAGVDAFRAHVDTRNLRSIALLERLGFTRTALLPNADTFKGTSSDEFRYERSA